MDLLRIFELFPGQESCIAHLENIRFGDKSYCPLCGGLKIARKSDNYRIGRWNCYECGSSFNVLSGTIFQKTKIPLQKWFLAISMLLDAKKSLSSHQLARHLNLNQGSTWYLTQRIRSEMASKQGFVMLHGIVEADESYIGGKPLIQAILHQTVPDRAGLLAVVAAHQRVYRTRRTSTDEERL